MRYLRARSAAEAVEMAGSDGAALLAGGTDLITMRANGLEVTTAIDIKHAADLGQIDITGTRARIGATATMRQIVRCARVPYLQGLADGAGVVGAPQTRARGTLGGNVCRASPAGDTLPALLALEAEVEIYDGEATTLVPLAQFVSGPGKTVLGRGQIVTAFHIAAANSASAYERFTYRDSLDLAVVGIAVAVEVVDGECAGARIALGGVAPTPVRAHTAEPLLLGRPSDVQLAEAGRAAATGCSPIDDVRATADFRRHAVSVLVGRVARRAMQAAGVGQ